MKLKKMTLLQLLGTRKKSMQEKSLLNIYTANQIPSTTFFDKSSCKIKAPISCFNCLGIFILPLVNGNLIFTFIYCRHLCSMKYPVLRRPWVPTAYIFIVSINRKIDSAPLEFHVLIKSTVEGLKTFRHFVFSE